MLPVGPNDAVEVWLALGGRLLDMLELVALTYIAARWRSDVRERGNGGPRRDAS